MPARKKTSPPKLRQTPRSYTKAISVMAWIEDPFGQALMVRQTQGKKLWALPGGKVRRGESLLGALRREILEETGHRVSLAYPIDMFDRPTRGQFVILYRALLKRSPARRRNAREISAVAYHAKLPPKSTPSARHFWQRALTSFEPLTLIKRI